jgi:hypothetical protein
MDHLADGGCKRRASIFVNHTEPELGSFGLLDLQPKNVLLVVCIERERR